MIHTPVTAEEAMRRLREGNEKYVSDSYFSGDVSSGKRMELDENGQHPFAIVVTCSDSRVLPEILFDAGLGDLFIVRTAGNIVNKHTMDSISYAVDHLHCKFILVLGHTNCGAVAEAMKISDEGYPEGLIADIFECIGDEKDPVKASCINAENTMRKILGFLPEGNDVTVKGALYDIRTGKVDFDIIH